MGNRRKVNPLLEFNYSELDAIEKYITFKLINEGREPNDKVSGDYILGEVNCLKKILKEIRSIDGR